MTPERSRAKSTSWKEVPTTNRVTRVKTKRSHEENQERAYVAASRRADRSLEARMQSAKMASEIHRQRTGRALKVSEEIVVNEEMYEEEEDDLIRAHFIMLPGQTHSPTMNVRVGPYHTTQTALAALARYHEVGRQFDETFPGYAIPQLVNLDGSAAQIDSTYPDVPLSPRQLMKPHPIGVQGQFNGAENGRTSPNTSTQIHPAPLSPPPNTVFTPPDYLARQHQQQHEQHEQYEQHEHQDQYRQSPSDAATFVSRSLRQPPILNAEVPNNPKRSDHIDVRYPVAMHLLGDNPAAIQTQQYPYETFQSANPAADAGSPGYTLDTIDSLFFDVNWDSLVDFDRPGE